MTVEADAAWERHPDGAYISVPIDPPDLDEVRAWCPGNCIGNYLIVPGRKIAFERSEDAALAAL